jgi:hypothetical protein
MTGIPPDGPAWITRHSMSGIIHQVNQTPVQWFCKKQKVVEPATYGSEFMVACQATEQIMDLRYTLPMMEFTGWSGLDAWRQPERYHIIKYSTFQPYHTIVSEKQSRLRYSISSTLKVN